MQTWRRDDIAAVTAHVETGRFRAHMLVESVNDAITILSGTDTSLSAGNQPVTKGEPGIYQQLADWWNTYEAPSQHIRVQLDVVAGGATTVR